MLKQLMRVAEGGNSAAIREAIKVLVPSYTPTLAEGKAASTAVTTTSTVTSPTPATLATSLTSVATPSESHAPIDLKSVN